MTNQKLSCDVDDITARAIGDFGPWQLRISVLMALLKLPMAWYQLNIIFMAPPQDFWCEKPYELSKYSDDEWRRMCLPHIEEYPCLIFDPDLLAMVPPLDRSLIPLVKCKKFIYNETVFRRTITSDWNLVCSQHWLVHGSVAALYLYSGELFPTLGRNAGVGGVTTFARIAALVAPAVVSLDSILPDLPMMLLAAVSIAQIFLIVPLPETKDYPLPDTLEQAEQFTR
ncbi:unnamed protein product [Diatraea saccharalis]|uniref:Uncharacterized protein n=1 Tax=Diatraea saccharalis TaxID=40085 RepID=A0A9N9R109_9NEOP|nr:unnamed protein product [Diatraea saccharalis]